jgi:SAM-dependent methyltransferase
MIQTLPRVVPAAPDKPVREEAKQTQRASRDLAEDPGRWSPEMARDTVRRYTELAPVWESERGGYRPIPLSDALARGGPLPGGPCLEVGAGTGLLTPLLSGVWRQVVSLDLTEPMLRRSNARWRVLADASRLPVRSGTVAAVVLADAPLFAGEVARVLIPDGVVVWSNALGAAAPHHVPIPTVLAALERAAPRRPWNAVTAEAGWGLWAVFRRTGG